MDTVKLIDAAKAHAGIPSDTALAKVLGTSQAAVWGWRAGRAAPRPENAQQLAELAGEDPAVIVLETLQQSAKTDALRETIARLKKVWTASNALLVVMTLQLEAVAVCILCSIRRLTPGYGLLYGLRCP
jgi:transcriptional regulator with XRE-family HTH domain